MFNARSKIIKKDDVSHSFENCGSLCIMSIVKAHRFGRRMCQVPFVTRDERTQLEGVIGTALHQQR